MDISAPKLCKSPGNGLLSRDVDSSEEGVCATVLLRGASCGEGGICGLDFGIIVWILKVEMFSVG